MRLRSLLYAAEVALKLQTFSTSTGGFFQVRFGGAESVLVLKASLLVGFPQELWSLLLVDLLSVF